MIEQAEASARDSYGAEAFQAGVPHDLFDRDRAAMPVRWVELGAQDGFWSVTSAPRVKEVLGDPPHHH